MPGLRQALGRINNSANRPSLRMERVDPEQIAMKTLELYGNSEIGMVANWQAMLNHGGHLDLDTMFSMSEVIDAVNYRSGDVEPVLSGLQDRAIEKILSGDKLPSGTPLNRVFGQLAKEWKARGLEEKYGRLVKSEISERMEWSEMLIAAMDQVVEKLSDSLQKRKLLCNGPVEVLLKHDIPDWAYAQVMEWDQWRTGLWAEFLKRRVASERRISASSFTERRALGEELNQEAKEIVARVELEFTSRLLDHHEKDEPGMYSMAYIQIEAVRESRWMNMRPMNMSPLISMLSYEDPRLVEELRVLSGAGRTVPTILKKLDTEADVRAFMSLPELRVEANMELNQLISQLREYLLDEDSKSLEINGRVGEDSNVVVMTISSST